MNHEAAQVLQKYLIDNSAGLVTDQADNEPWPAYFSTLPAEPNALVVIYGTKGRVEGRGTRATPTLTHPGYQVRVRALDPNTAYDQAQTLANFLDTIYFGDVIFDDGAQYKIQEVMRTTDILPLGPEDEKQRVSYVFNGYMTVTRTF